jgi:hypothetical protein
MKRTIILSDHARERMFLRSISKSLIQSALDNHDETKLEDDGDTCFIKNVKRGDTTRKLHAIGKPLPDQGKNTWLIKTVYIRGEDDPTGLMKIIKMVIWRFFFQKK